MDALKYFFGEAWSSLRRGGRAAIVAVLAIAGALFVPGSFLVATVNLRGLVASWSEGAELSIYVSHEATETMRADIERVLARSPIVAGTTFVSKEQALQRFQRDFGELAADAGALGSNPFPASIEVRLRSGASAGEAVGGLAQEVSRLPGVEDVQYDRRWIDRLNAAVAIVGGLGAMLAVVLFAAAALTVASVVRLAAYARRDEVEIMKLVGAPLSYIRGPFVVEGFLQGGAGGLLALLLLWIGFQVGTARYGTLVTDVLGLPGLSFISVPLCLALLTGGMLVGCVGGALASRTAEA